MEIPSVKTTSPPLVHVHELVLATVTETLVLIAVTVPLVLQLEGSAFATVKVPPTIAELVSGTR